MRPSTVPARTTKGKHKTHTQITKEKKKTNQTKRRPAKSTPHTCGVHGVGELQGPGLAGVAMGPASTQSSFPSPAPEAGRARVEEPEGSSMGNSSSPGVPAPLGPCSHPCVLWPGEEAGRSPTSRALCFSTVGLPAAERSKPGRTPMSLGREALGGQLSPTPPPSCGVKADLLPAGPQPSQPFPCRAWPVGERG